MVPYVFPLGILKRRTYRNLTCELRIENSCTPGVWHKVKNFSVYSQSVSPSYAHRFRDRSGRIVREKGFDSDYKRRLEPFGEALERAFTIIDTHFADLNLVPGIRVFIRLTSKEGCFVGGRDRYPYIEFGQESDPRQAHLFPGYSPKPGDIDARMFFLDPYFRQPSRIGEQGTGS